MRTKGQTIEPIHKARNTELTIWNRWIQWVIMCPNLPAKWNGHVAELGSYIGKNTLTVEEYEHDYIRHVESNLKTSFRLESHRIKQSNV